MHQVPVLVLLFSACLQHTTLSHPHSLNFPDSGRQRAVLDQESFLSKLDSKYQDLQEFASAFKSPQPIVDTISEYEKYGNDGGKIREGSKALIGAIEAGSNILNGIFDVPSAILSQTNKKVQNILGPIGSKISIA